MSISGGGGGSSSGGNSSGRSGGSGGDNSGGSSGNSSGGGSKLLWTTSEARTSGKVLCIGSLLAEVAPGDVVIGIGAKPQRQAVGYAHEPTLDTHSPAVVEAFAAAVRGGEREGTRAFHYETMPHSASLTSAVTADTTGQSHYDSPPAARSTIIRGFRGSRTCGVLEQAITTAKHTATATHTHTNTYTATHTLTAVRQRTGREGRTGQEGLTGREDRLTGREGRHGARAAAAVTADVPAAATADVTAPSHVTAGSGVCSTTFTLGDPALVARLLLPEWRTFQWRPAHTVGRPAMLCVVPHMSDDNLRHRAAVAAVAAPCERAWNATVRILSVTRLSPAEFARQLQFCNLVAASALHGIILADAIGVPSVWLANLTELATTHHRA